MQRLGPYLRKLVALSSAAVLIGAGWSVEASSGTAIPDPANWALFAMGVLGLIIGRQSSRKPPRD